MNRPTPSLLRSCAVAVAALSALAIGAPLQAQTADVVLAISEGTSGGTDHAQVIAKYGELARLIGDAARQPVKVVFVREFAQLEDGLRAGRFNYVMARPSDFPARGLRDHGYQYVSTARPEGQCVIYAPKGSPITTLEQARGARWVMPEKVSYMARFCRAELRDRGIRLDAEKVQHVREQGAVKFYVDNRFADVGGVASYSGARKDFDRDGAVVIHRSVAQPFFPLIANARTTPAQITAIQQALLQAKDTPSGQAMLQRIGVQGFDTTSEKALRGLLPWLEK